MNKHEVPKVVILGGGTGMPVVLKGLKNLPLHVTTIVTVADDGGSTGEIRKQMNMPAPGDVRNVIVAMSQVDEDLQQLFQYRLEGNNRLKGHALGNLVLVAMQSMTGDFSSSINKIASLFQVKGTIYPVVNEPVTLHAEMMNGTTVSGESNIEQSKNSKIKRIYLTPEQVKPFPKVIEAILEADLIVISPGSLYTSILPNIVLPDIGKALLKTKAPITYICNVMTQSGETDDYKVSQHVEAIYNHVSAEIIDSVIVNNEPIQRHILAKYAKENAEPVVLDKEKLNQYNLKVIEANIVDQEQDVLRHNGEKLANIIYNMTQDNKMN